MNPLTFKQKLFLAAIPVVMIVAMVLIAHDSSRFKVAAMDPAQNGRIPSYGVIILTYSSPINADNVAITTTPQFSFTKKVDNKKLILTPSNPLTANADYTVQVNKICDKSHAGSCADLTLHFTVDESLTYSSLSSDQQQQIVGQVDSQYQQVPILSILPVNATDYLIEAKPSANYTYIVITPNVFPDGMTSDEYTAAYNKYYQEGRDYLTSKGYQLKTANYTVMSDQEFNSLSSGGD